MKPVEWAFSCTNCLTEDEVARLCAPVAQFVIERMLRQATDPKVAADGTAKARDINAENVKTLMRVRTQLRYEDGPGRSGKELAARARKALHGGERPYEASEMFRQVKDSDNSIVRKAAHMIESGDAPPEEALTRCLLALGKEYERQQELIVELYSRAPFGDPFVGIPFVVNDRIPANEIRVRETRPHDGGTVTMKITRVRSATGAVASSADSPAPVLASLSGEAPKCAHCQRPSTGLSYSLCPECINCHSWFDGTGYVFEDVPYKNCTHLNRAQRRFIYDVGTRYAYADGGKRLAELAGGPGHDGGSRTADANAEPATWVCANHPPGFEIKYPLSTPKCEVCGTPQS
jgi:hypothetical protein